MKKTGLWSQADLCLKHSPCGHMQDVHTPQSKSWTRSTHTPWARPHPHSPESDCISGSSPGLPMRLEISKHCLHLAEPQYPQLQSGGGVPYVSGNTSSSTVHRGVRPPTTSEFDFPGRGAATLGVPLAACDQGDRPEASQRESCRLYRSQDSLGLDIEPLLNNFSDDSRLR